MEGMRLLITKWTFMGPAPRIQHWFNFNLFTMDKYDTNSLPCLCTWLCTQIQSFHLQEHTQDYNAKINW